MKLLLPSLCFLLLLHNSLHGQEFLSSNRFSPLPDLPNSQSHFPDLNIDYFGAITPTSDGGYAMVGSFLLANLRYGIVLKVDQDDNIQWWYCYGNGDNPSDMYFRDVVEIGSNLFIVGDGIVNGVRYPYVQRTKVTQNIASVTFDQSYRVEDLPGGYGLTIEDTYNPSRLVIGGHQFSDPPDRRSSQTVQNGYFFQLQHDPVLGDEDGSPVKLAAGTKIQKIDKSEYGRLFYFFGEKKYIKHIYIYI